MNAEDDIDYHNTCDGDKSERSHSPDPSVLSLKSEKSMKTPMQLKDGDSPVDQRERSHSPDPSVWSLKSDKSMKTPMQLKDGDSPVDQRERSHSPDPSVWSLKSDKSMKTPMQLKDGNCPVGQRERSHSPDPSVLSLKSNKSMKTPMQLKDGDSPVDQRYKQQTNVSEIQHGLKSHIKIKHQHVFEGLGKQGNATLLNEIYTELYIVEGETGEISNKHEFTMMENTLKTTATASTPIKCRDIFRALPGQDIAIRTVLTKGVAGIGKTVSVQKFTLDWAEEKENQDIQLIFPLPFREINLMKEKTLSLVSLLQHFFMTEISLHLIQNSSIIFIFDGLDECRLPLKFHSNETLRDVTKEASVDVLLTNLIVGNLLPSALIWITSRPAAADLVPSECVHRVTEVRGFNDPHKEEYFRKRISDQSLADTVISHLKSSRSLYIMCHIPVFCWISATVLEKMLSEAEGGEIPKTLTQMYTHFLMAQVSISDTKYNEKDNKDEEMILKLSKLAYEQLERGNIIFYEEDLRECGIDVTEASVYSGLCTQIFREVGFYHMKVFSFVHLSIQEHLAALYVHLTFHNSGENVLQAHKSETPVTMFSLHKCAVKKALESKNGHLDLFLRFLMGFSLESNHSLLEGFLMKKTHRCLEKEKTVKYLKEETLHRHCPKDCFLFLHCLSELNDHSLIDEIKNFLACGKLEQQHKSLPLGSGLVYILMTSDEKFEEFELQKYGKSEDLIQWLHPVIKVSTKARLNDCNITSKGCTILCTLFTSQSKVRELDLSHNNLQDTGVEILCIGVNRSDHAESIMKDFFNEKNTKSASCHSHNREKFHLKHRTAGHLDTECNLESLKMKDFSNEQNTVSSASCHLYNREKFHLKHGTAGLQDAECNLESLNLKNCGVTQAGCEFLSKALSLNPSHLKVLDLSWNDIGDTGVKHLCAALEKVQCALETLKLDTCGMTERSCTALASALSSKTSSLTDLDLSTNDLQDSGVKKLCVGLQSPHCKLQKLRLSKCNVTHGGVTALTEALKSNPSQLKELDLLDNDLKESDLKMISVILDKPSFSEKKHI